MMDSGDLLIKGSGGGLVLNLLPERQATTATTRRAYVAIDVHEGEERVRAHLENKDRGRTHVVLISTQ